jgi:hypothetical protein
VLIGTITVAGTEGDGILTLIGGLIAGAVGIPTVLLGRLMNWGFAVVIMLIGVAVGLLVVYDMVNLQSVIGDIPEDVPARASIGIGLWLTLLGVISLIAGGLWGGLSGVERGRQPMT